MAKPGRRSGQALSRDSADEVRNRIIDAAFQTLRYDGFGEASARSISERGGFNQSQIFYYFGTINDLLLAALERSSRDQMDFYATAFDDCDTLADLFQVVGDRLQADLESGHIKVLTELILGSNTDPLLKKQVASNYEPWHLLAVRTIERILGNLGLAEVLPADQIAFAIISMLIGMDLMINLTERSEYASDLFGTGKNLLDLFTGVFVSQIPKSLDGADEKRTPT